MGVTFAVVGMISDSCCWISQCIACWMEKGNGKSRGLKNHLALKHGFPGLSGKCFNALMRRKT